MAVKPTATPEKPDATDAAVATTAITVGGAEYNLKGLSIEDGNKIYAALPPDYQKLADSYAKLAKAFESVVEVDLPPGMSFDKAWKEFLTAPRDAAGKITDTTKPYLKQLETRFEPILSEIPGYKAAKGTKEALDFGGTMLQGGKDFLMFFPRVIGLGGAVIAEGTHAVIPGISDAQAKAFGAAYAGAIFHEGAVRTAMPMFDSPFNNDRSLFWSYPVEASLAGMEHAAMKWPVVKDVWPLIAGFAKWAMEALGHIGQEGKTRSLTEVIDSVKKEIADKQQGRDTSWRGLTEDRLRESEIGVAEQKMLRAEKVAGVDTKGRVELIANGGTMINQNGNLTTVNPTGGGNVNVTEQQIPGSNGKPPQPQGRGDRLMALVGNLGGPTVKNLLDPQLDEKDAPGLISLGIGAAATVPFTEGYRAARVRGMERVVKQLGDRAAALEKKAADAAKGVTDGTLASKANKAVGGRLPFYNEGKEAAQLAENAEKWAKEAADLRLREAAMKDVVEARKAGMTKGFFGTRFGSGALANTGNELKGIRHLPGNVVRQIGGVFGLGANGTQHATGNMVEAAGRQVMREVDDVKLMARNVVTFPERVVAGVKGLKTNFDDFMDGKSAQRMEAFKGATKAAGEAAPAAKPVAAAAPVVAEAAEAVTATAGRTGFFRGAAGKVGGLISKGPGWAKAVGAGLVAWGATATVASASEAKKNYSDGNKGDAAAGAIDAAALAGGLVSSTIGIWVAAPAMYLSEGLRLDNQSKRADNVPDDQARALIAMVKGAVKVEDPCLRKIQILKQERDVRLAAGKSLEVNVTISSNGNNIIDITDPQRGGGFSGEGMPMSYNTNLNAKLMEEAKLYLGSFGTTQQVAAMMGVKPDELAAITASSKAPAKGTAAKPAAPDAGLQMAAAEATMKAQAAESKARAAAKPVGQVMSSKVAIGAVHKGNADGGKLLEMAGDAFDNFKDSLPKLSKNLPFTNLFG